MSRASQRVSSDICLPMRAEEEVVGWWSYLPLGPLLLPAPLSWPASV